MLKQKARKKEQEEIKMQKILPDVMKEQEEIKMQKILPDVMKEQEEIKMQKILPDVMKTSYTQFVTQERDNLLLPLQAELKALENQGRKLRNLYAEASLNGSALARDKVTAAMMENKQRLEKKQAELQLAERESQVDERIRELARQLDQVKERELLYRLYIQIWKDANTLLARSDKAAELAHMCGVPATVGDIRGCFVNILPNLQHDLEYNVTMPDKAALQNALEERLQEVKQEREKVKMLDEKLEVV